jgi:hypothetical protein
MTILGCPVCKADNAQGPACRRCKADLSLLWALETRRTWALQEALRELATGRWDEAATRAEEAEGLRGNEESRRLLAVGRLMQADYAGAWESLRGRQVPTTNSQFSS